MKNIKKCDNIEDTKSAPNNNFTVKDHIFSICYNSNNNTKNRLGIMALIAIMEPASESHTFRAHKQPLKSCPSKKIKVPLDSGSN